MRGTRELLNHCRAIFFFFFYHRHHYIYFSFGGSFTRIGVYIPIPIYIWSAKSFHTDYRDDNRKRNMERGEKERR